MSALKQILLSIGESINALYKGEFAEELIEIQTKEGVVLYAKALAENEQVSIKGEDGESYVNAVDADYTTSDGKLITVTDSKIASIKDAESEPAETELAETPAEDQPAANDELAELKSRVDELTKIVSELTKALTIQDEAMSSVNTELSAIKQQPIQENFSRTVAPEAMSASTKAFKEHQRLKGKN